MFHGYWCFASAMHCNVQDEWVWQNAILVMSVERNSPTEVIQKPRQTATLGNLKLESFTKLNLKKFFQFKGPLPRGLYHPWHHDPNEGTEPWLPFFLVLIINIIIINIIIIVIGFTLINAEDGVKGGRVVGPSHAWPVCFLWDTYGKLAPNGSYHWCW